MHPEETGEAEVLRHIQRVAEHGALLRQLLRDGGTLAEDQEMSALQSMWSLMKFSFEEDGRISMSELGALQVIASVVQHNHVLRGSVGGGHESRSDGSNTALRRYAATALANLTVGNSVHKAALCSNEGFMRAFVGQLTSTADDLLQVTAHVLRNLSWRVDDETRQALSNAGTVSALTRAVMSNKKEATIRALLSALWNLTSHCSNNKAEICAVDGALAFLVDSIRPGKTMAIVESAGGILRNISSHVAENEPYRVILRQRNCLSILLSQLASESLTIVSNACGALWNLSANCPEDQRHLIAHKAVQRLQPLAQSRHIMIASASRAVLKNLTEFQPAAVTQIRLESATSLLPLRAVPTLAARKQRAKVEEASWSQTKSGADEASELATPDEASREQAAQHVGVVQVAPSSPGTTFTPVSELTVSLLPVVASPRSSDSRHASGRDAPAASEAGQPSGSLTKSHAKPRIRQQTNGPGRAQDVRRRAQDVRRKAKDVRRRVKNVRREAKDEFCGTVTPRKAANVSARLPMKRPTIVAMQLTMATDAKPRPPPKESGTEPFPLFVLVYSRVVI